MDSSHLAVCQRDRRSGVSDAVSPVEKTSSAGGTAHATCLLLGHCQLGCLQIHVRGFPRFQPSLWKPCLSNSSVLAVSDSARPVRAVALRSWTAPPHGIVIAGPHSSDGEMPNRIAKAHPWRWLPEILFHRYQGHPPACPAVLHVPETVPPSARNTTSAWSSAALRFTGPAISVLAADGGPTPDSKADPAPKPAAVGAGIQIGNVE